MVDEDVLTAEEIARVAGVARGTVSNWRRRHAEFPAPVSGTGRGLVFNRAEVEAWLAGAGLLELAQNARLWREVEHAARGTSLGTVVATVAKTVTSHADGQAPEDDLPASLAWAAERAVDEAGAVAVLGDLIDRYSVASGHYVTPARIAEFMVSLAAIGEGATVLDPASGTGELLAAALAQGAERVLAQEASIEAAALAKTRLLPGEGQRTEVAVGESLRADAFAGVEADAVLCRPLLLADGPELELTWAQHALAHLKPGGQAVVLLPPSAATSPAGSQIRMDLLRAGALRAVIELPPSAGSPSDVPPHLWLLRRPGDAAPDSDAPDSEAPDSEADPDLLALFAEPGPDRRAGQDAAVTVPVIEAMSAAEWQAFTRTVGHAWEHLNDPERRTIASGGGRNAHYCITRVADLLDDTLLDESERLGEAFAITPGRVKAHFSAVCRVRDAEHAATRRRQGIPEHKNPARSFSHARISLALIPVDVDGITKTLRHFDWLDAPDVRTPAASRPPAVWPPKAAQPADPWRTATVPELARLGLLRYRRADSAHAELLRPGDVLVPATLTENAMATVVDKKQEGDPAGPGAHLIRPDPARLDPWFLAGFLTASATRQQATTGTSAPRIDVRQLEVPLLPLEDQERYAAAFRRLRYLKSAAASITDKMANLTSHLTTGLTVGEIRLEAETTA
jgi:predicted DNA-binding transcriptional regulator AlpA/protein-L-isoaspartate O-methyltransferase